VSILKITALNNKIGHNEDNYYKELIRVALSALEDDPLVYYESTKKLIREASVEIEKRKDTSTEADFILAVQYIREREFTTAFNKLYGVLNKNPDWCEAYCYLGYIGFKYSISTFEACETYLQQAINCNPNKARYYSFLATLYRNEFNNTEDKKYLELAKQNFEKAIQIDPEDINAYNNYANFLVETGDYDKAELYYKKAIEIFPNHGKPYYNLACLKSIQGDADTAIKYLKQALDKNPNFRYDAKNDPDFDSIRNTPQFKELIYNYYGSTDKNQSLKDSVR